MTPAVQIQIAADDDVMGFWKAVARLEAGGIAPDHAVFAVAGSHADLFGSAAAEEGGFPRGCAKVEKLPVRMREHLDKILLHASPERFALVYRLVRRWRENPHLFAIGSDPDVARAASMGKSVRRDMHKMTAFVRFREVESGDGAKSYVAWFEPEHHVVAATAPFFMKRFTSMRWSILTPRRSAHWDRERLTIAEGRSQSDAAPGDPLEEVWRTYYAHIFNPARLKVDSMRAHMPKKYWKNLPEARLIAPLIQSAQARSEAMIALGPSPHRRRARSPSGSPVPGCGAQSATLPEASSPGSLVEIASQLCRCHRCPLHAQATQAVAGEGPAHARLMIVGEQPGDQEDLAGRPFVGPAGQLLDVALQRVGIARQEAFVTNAVKHFKYEARGKVRLHKAPNVSEIDHCRWWLDLEIDLIKPELIICLGASAARAILHRSVAVKDVRAQVLPLVNDRHALITVHPSYLLRLQDEGEKHAAWQAFLGDLSRARDWLNVRTPALQSAEA